MAVVEFLQFRGAQPLAHLSLLGHASREGWDTTNGPNSQILERTTVVFGAPYYRVYETTYTYQVTGSTFEDPAHQITGELRGAPWQWTEWTKWTRREDGGVSVSVSTLDPLKTTIDTTVMDAQGNVVSTSHSEMLALPQTP